MGRPRTKLDFPDHHEETVQPWLWVKLGLIVLAIVWLIAFGIKNHEQSEIDFVFWSSEVSRIWLILLSLVIGIVIGMLLSQLYRHRQRLRRPQRPVQSPDPFGNVGGRGEAVGKPGGTLPGGTSPSSSGRPPASPSG
jgi:uncharacterized integral membrane protein